MPGEILPPDPQPEPRNDPPTRDDRQRTIVCECCGSKLDRRGGLLRRGDLAKQMIDAEDTIDTLRKQLKKAGDDLAALKTELDEAKAAIKPERKRIWDREA